MSGFCAVLIYWENTFEIHKHRHNFVARHSIAGRRGQIEPEAMKRRHDELVVEMLRRGYNHNSPYEQPDLSHLTDEERYDKVDLKFNLEDLHGRCEECRKRYERSSMETKKGNKVQV